MIGLKMRRENGEEIPLGNTTPLRPGHGPQRRSLLMMDYLEELSSALLNHTPQIYIDERIGRGGFCSVFQGSYLDKEGERVLCAVKIPNPDFLIPSRGRNASLEEALFNQECLLHPIISRLAPNVVKPYFVGRAGDNKEFPFMVMQLMQDYTGANIAYRPEKYNLGDRIGVIRDIARCLFYMHRKGYLHCDIKPENIFFPFPDESSDRLIRGYLGDFGLARSIHGTGSIPSEELLGSPEYMAPEQVLDGRADEKSDQFSLGVVLYNFLSHQMPRETLYEISEPYERAQMIAQAPIITQPAGIYAEERGFLPIALKALERNPDKRFENIAAMDYALKQATHQHCDPLAPPKRNEGIFRNLIYRLKSTLGFHEPFQQQ